MPETHTPGEAMLLEAQAALGSEDRGHARDLLTRLIKTEPNNAEAWVWMSAAVETAKERVYCLNEALRLDPQNQIARRGLIALGALSPDPALVIPLELQQRDWQTQMFSGSEKDIAASTTRQAIILGASLVGLVALVVVIGILIANQRNAAALPAAPLPTYGFYTTADASDTPVPGQITPLPIQPAGVIKLAATYTPTPLYVSTPHRISEDYRSALKAYQEGDWASAAAFFQLAANTEKSADIYYLLGEALRFQKKTKDASQAYEKAIQLDANFAPAYLGRARLNRANNPDLPAIQADLEKAISLDPNLNEAYLELAAFMIDKKDGKAALKYLGFSAQLNPLSPLLYLYRAQAELLTSQPDLALQDATLANQADLTLLPVYRLLAETLRLNNRVADSLAPLETYTHYVSDDEIAWTWLGMAYHENGRQDDAVQALGEALALDNLLFDAHLLRAQIYLDQKDGKNAGEDFRIALGLRSDSFAASLGRGQAYLASGDFLSAVDQLNLAFKIVQSDSERAAVYYYRAKALDGLHNTPLAIQSYEALLKLPTSSYLAAWGEEARQRLGQLYTATPTPRLSLTPTITPTATITPTRTITSTRTIIPTATHIP